MPTSKQRRDAARRHLERQLERRQQREARRKQMNVIASIVGVVVVVAVVIVTVVVLGGSDKKTDTASSPTASTTPTASASASPTATSSPLPSRTPAPIAARAARHTDGPCDYAENAATLTKGNLFDVGLPPDPNPTPTVDKSATFVTSVGTIVVKFDAQGAPCNVQSLEYLIGKRFYDDTASPRAFNSGIFGIQVGDPSGTTGGGPTYTTKDENLKNAKYPAGTVAMANSGANTNGSQFFFITKDSTTALGPKYTVVGHVTSGEQFLEKVVDSGNDGSNQYGGGKPNIPFIIKTVRMDS